MENLDIVISLLMTLPESYNTIVSALETLDPNQLDIEFVRGRLLDEANKRKCLDSGIYGGNEDVAMHGAAGKFRWKCYFCKRIGHKKSSCPKLRKLNNGEKFQKRANVCVSEDDDDGSSEIAFLAEDNVVGESLQYHNSV